MFIWGTIFWKCPVHWCARITLLYRRESENITPRWRGILVVLCGRIVRLSCFWREFDVISAWPQKSSKCTTKEYASSGERTFTCHSGTVTVPQVGRGLRNYSFVSPRSPSGTITVPQWSEDYVNGWWIVNDNPNCLTVYMSRTQNLLLLELDEISKVFLNVVSLKTVN